MATFATTWLQVDDVKDWLRLNEQDVTDDDLLTRVAAMTEPYVEARRPEFVRVVDDVVTYVPDAEVYQGAIMYAARYYRRRNSPAGIELFGDVTSFVSRYDPDIERALQTGSYARPVVS